MDLSGCLLAKPAQITQHKLESNNMKKHFNLLPHLTLLSSLLLILPVSLSANSPVKSIDADGNVTYSDKPVAGAHAVKKIPLNAGPSVSEIDAAQEKAQNKIERADKVDLTPAKPAKKQVNTNKPNEMERQVINAGNPNRPYQDKPKPRPPIERPGTNPPASNLPARTRPSGVSGGGRRGGGR